MDDLAEVGFCPLALEEVLGLSCAVGWCLTGIEGLQAVFAYRESGRFIISCFWWLTQTYKGSLAEGGGMKREQPGK